MLATQRWYRRRRAPDSFLQQFANLDSVLARVLYARGIDSSELIRAFLTDEGDLGNPFRMAGMSEAVTRIRRALASRERIVVYGDFDVDGVSATVLLVSALRMLGGQVEPYIPDRFAESYGLNIPALERLRQDPTDLVVTVDCGIRSVDEANRARAIGLDLVITDHHSVPRELPPALAVIDPKRPDCRYPFEALSGVGVAYRLAEALFRVENRMRRHGTTPLEHEQFLDLVALGTIADIVPLQGENRTLARRGLERMRLSPRVGLRALMAVAAVDPEKLDSQAISFRLAPRLNAAGRLENGRLAYRLLMSASEDEAGQLSSELDQINRRRQELLEQQLEEARQALGEGFGRPVLIVDGPGFHEGIVGLIASRLTDEFYRPALVMRRGEETTRGSARSIEGFHITHALDACSDLLMRYGGHARAAGLTLATKHVPVFRERLESYCAEHIDEEILSRRLSVDAIVKLAEISEETISALATLEPFGEGNPGPCLASQELRVLASWAVGQDGKHLRMQVGEDGQSLPAVAFRQGHLASEFSRDDLVDLVYRPTINEWEGSAHIELVVEAIRPSKQGAEAGQ